MNEAMRDWVANVHDTFYIIGSAAGPHPYPAMVRDFQTVIGKETRAQMMEREGRLPDLLIACVGGGSNAIGLFHPFLDESSRRHSRRRSGGRGASRPRITRRRCPRARPACCTARAPICLQDEDGQVLEAHSISAGLDYPGVGPEHSWLKETGRVTYVSATDAEALDAFQLTCRLEGIIPALESAHAVAHAMRMAPKMREGQDHRRRALRPRRQGRVHRRQRAG